MHDGKFIAAIDQGTTSSRCMIFDHDGAVVAVAQKEHAQHFPRPGWVEHDASEIWRTVQDVVAEALEKAGLGVAGSVPAGTAASGTAASGTAASGPPISGLAAIGITNQRETTVVWDRATGEPVANAIVWQDTRTDAIVTRLGADGGVDWFRDRTGLTLATYFAGPKLLWLLENIPGLRERAEGGEVLFGTMDSWLIWNLTGGTGGSGAGGERHGAGRHVTDVTNASRTLLMDLRELTWDDELLERLEIPRAMLPEIVSSSEVYGTVTGLAGGALGGALDGVPVAGALGDQHAALVGQTAFDEGDLKSTYGTGAFLLLNTGDAPVTSHNGLLSTVAFKLGDAPAQYALEGSIAVSGSLVQWFRDQLGAIESASEIEALAASVDDNGGCYFVPAFSGLFAPHWRSDARGVIAGLTGYVTKAHIARAILEASAWQTRELVDAMVADTGLELQELRVDGGMTANSLLLQLLADALDVEVVRPRVVETTCLGAAYAAGLAVGFWPDVDALRTNWQAEAVWRPAVAPERRESEYSQWKKTVERTLDWVE